MADELIADAAMALAGPAVGDMVEKVRSIVSGAGSLEEAVAAIERAALAKDAPANLTAAMRQALMLAWLTGEAAELDRDTALDA